MYGSGCICGFVLVMDLVYVFGCLEMPLEIMILLLSLISIMIVLMPDISVKIDLVWTSSAA
jgi:hypothetical protein